MALWVLLIIAAVLLALAVFRSPAPVHDSRHKDELVYPATQPLPKPRKAGATALSVSFDQTTAPVAMGPEIDPKLWSGDLHTRERAMEALTDLDNNTVIETFILLLTDVDADMRESSVYALADLGGPEAVELIESALMDPDPGVRAAAADSLEELAAVSPKTP